ncbi:hypothetical protein LOD99_11727 [Oopsacas minuta]|uniref:Uncharacterized protein n=1 Tax=Oopsacas minuta TaxID=111878 RepID=A0AAV7JLM8_9METZ|nr:hypothetical protein LOD99_11727 [Oopsacas minuta]
MDIFTVNFSPPSPTANEIPSLLEVFSKEIIEPPKEVFFEPHFNLGSSDMQAYPCGDFPMTYTTETVEESSHSPSIVPSANLATDLNKQNEISAFDHKTDDVTISPTHYSHTQLPSGPNSVKSTDSLLADDSDGSLSEQNIKETRAPRKLAPRPIEPIHFEKSVLVLGREFDQPNQIAYTLEKRFGDIFHEHGVHIDSLPVPSHRLLSADPSRLLKRVYSCLLLCYNATEARLLVTSEGGYYSSLIPYALNALGNNKVMLAFTHCQTNSKNLLATDLQSRILAQPHMQPMMNQFRSIFSWAETPNDVHIQRMLEIINESPVYMVTKKSCSII